MKKDIIKKLLPINIIVLFIAILLTFCVDTAVIQANQITPVDTGITVIIDAGHGLPDGGTTSCTGVIEADINLEISRRLNDLFHFIGIKTIMTRENQESIYTEGNTIAQKKVSDTRNRVKKINSIRDGLLLSIHQNHFYDSQYAGAQVFHANNEESKNFARKLQSDLTANLNPSSNRKAKKSSGVYLMEHIKCTGVLIECGFLSNPHEEYLLRSDQYQKQLCAVIVTSTQSYINQHSAS